MGDETPPRTKDCGHLTQCGTPEKDKENQCKPGECVSPDLLERAARWLVSHRDEIIGPVIPALKERFGLKNLQAIEVTKRAHALRFGGHL